MRVFVMADIHGAYKALLQCLQRSGFDYHEDMLIQLGDVVDGYNEAFECVNELLKIKKLIAIRGNHDGWLDSFIQSGYHPSSWSHGGMATAWSYLKQVGKERRIVFKGGHCKTALNPEDIPASHADFFRKQLLYHIDSDNNCFLHAGFNRHMAFQEQKPETYYWDRELWLEALAYQIDSWRNHDEKRDGFNMVTAFREIYIGHTPTTNWNITRPLQAVNIFNLDTGAGSTGKLTIMNIHTKEYWQSDNVDLLYERNWR